MRCVGVYVLLESLVPFLSDVLESRVPFLSDDHFTNPAAVTVEEKNGSKLQRCHCRRMGDQELLPVWLKSWLISSGATGAPLSFR